MNAKYFIADHCLWLLAIIILTAALAAFALKSYFKAIALLQVQLAENRKLTKLIKEYETDHTDALEHLNAANERKLKSQHFAHTAMKDEQRLRHNKTIEVMATGHLKELQKLKSEHAKELADLKEAHKKTVEGLKGGYTYAIEERQYQFETIRTRYENFFRLTDQFDSDNLVRTKQTIFTILNDFERNYIQALKYNNKRNAETAAKVATKRLQKLTLDATQEYFKIKEEINTIRLIANMTCLQKLEELAEVYDRYMEAFKKLMAEFIPLLLAQKIDKIGENEHYLHEAEKAIPAIKEALIGLTRVEVRAA